MRNFLKNWNLRRVLYLLGGCLFVAIAVNDRTWWMAIFGIYFISMALFRFGCAAGNCELKTEKTAEHPENHN